MSIVFLLVIDCFVAGTLLVLNAPGWMWAVFAFMLVVTAIDLAITPDE